LCCPRCGSTGLFGHKNLNNTLVYTQLVSLSDGDYASRVAKDIKELCQLAEAGFEYVTDMDGVKVFRKRK
jgi:hypothetical protein